MGLDLWVVCLILIVGSICLTAMGTVLAGLYQKCGPNQAMIISGFGAAEDDRSFKIVVGGGDIVLPMLQQRDILSLEVMTMKLQTDSPVFTKDGDSLSIEGVVQAKVKSDKASIAVAAEHFLGKGVDEIVMITSDALVGHLRAEVRTMTAEQVKESPDLVAHRVMEASIPALGKMGLTVVSLTIKEIKQSEGRVPRAIG